jgi:hypothetical protein
MARPSLRYSRRSGTLGFNSVGVRPADLRNTDRLGVAGRPESVTQRRAGACAFEPGQQFGSEQHAEWRNARAARNSETGRSPITSGKRARWTVGIRRADHPFCRAPSRCHAACWAVGMIAGRERTCPCRTVCDLAVPVPVFTAGGGRAMEQIPVGCGKGTDPIRTSPSTTAGLARRPSLTAFRSSSKGADYDAMPDVQVIKIRRSFGARLLGPT